LTGPAEMSLHETHMTRCLELARVARDRGETAVGSIVVRGDVVIGEGLEATRALLDPTAHAEVQALLAACKYQGSLNLSGCALYTTVEPCVLCGYAIRKSGIAQVVYGMPTSQAGAITSSYKILSDETLIGWPPPPAVITGVLAEQCAALLRR
jgi:tRNA(adenine34) deaminase